MANKKHAAPSSRLKPLVRAASEDETVGTHTCASNDNSRRRASQSSDNNESLSTQQLENLRIRELAEDGEKNECKVHEADSSSDELVRTLTTSAVQRRQVARQDGSETPTLASAYRVHGATHAALDIPPPPEKRTGTTFHQLSAEARQLPSPTDMHVDEAGTNQIAIDEHLRPPSFDLVQGESNASALNWRPFTYMQLPLSDYAFALRSAQWPAVSLPARFLEQPLWPFIPHPYGAPAPLYNAAPLGGELPPRQVGNVQGSQEVPQPASVEPRRAEPPQPEAPSRTDPNRTPSGINVHRNARRRRTGGRQANRHVLAEAAKLIRLRSTVQMTQREMVDFLREQYERSTLARQLRISRSALCKWERAINRMPEPLFRIVEDLSRQCPTTLAQARDALRARRENQRAL